MNILSCIAFRAICVLDYGKPNMICYRETTDNRMTYIIAGNMGQADEASAKIVDDIVGGITFVNFSNVGYQPNQFVNYIMRDRRALPEGTEVTFVAISLGNQVGQFISNRTSDTLYAINPCMGTKFLNTPMKAACISASVVGELLNVALGWLSFVPVFNLADSPPTHDYSLETLINQFSAIWLLPAACPDNPDLTKVVISNQDELLNNAVIEEFFAGCEIVRIEAKHGSINNYPEEYRAALIELGLFGK